MFQGLLISISKNGTHIDVTREHVENYIPLILKSINNN